MGWSPVVPRPQPTFVGVLGRFWAHLGPVLGTPTTSTDVESTSRGVARCAQARGGSPLLWVVAACFPDARWARNRPKTSWKRLVSVILTPSWGHILQHTSPYVSKKIRPTLWERKSCPPGHGIASARGNRPFLCILCADIDLPAQCVGPAELTGGHACHATHTHRCHGGSCLGGRSYSFLRLSAAHTCPTREQPATYFRTAIRLKV